MGYETNRRTLEAVLKSAFYVKYQPGTTDEEAKKAFVAGRILAMEVAENREDDVLGGIDGLSEVRDDESMGEVSINIYSLKMFGDPVLRFVDENGYSYKADQMVEGDDLTFTGPLVGVDSDVVKVDRAVMAALGEALGGGAGSLYDEQAFRVQMS